MRKIFRKKFLILGLVALAVLILVIVGLKGFSGEDDWICQNGEWVKHGNPSAPEPTTFCGKGPLEPEQPEDESKIDTSNWVTYRNTAYGFELKYPAENWKVDAVKGEDPNTSPTPSFNHLCQGSAYCGALIIYAKQDSYNPKFKLEDYFFIMDLKEEISRKKIKIGGEDALRAEFTRLNTPAGKTEVIIYVLHKGKIYRIFPSFPDIEPEDLNPGDTLPYTDVQDAILSTFEFLN